MMLSLSEAPTRQTRSDHNTGNYVPYSFVCLNLYLGKTYIHDIYSKSLLKTGWVTQGLKLTEV